MNMTVKQNDPTDGVLYVKLEYNFNMIVPFGNVVIYSILNISDNFKMWSYEAQDQAISHAQTNYGGEYRIKLMSECRMRMQN